MGIGLCGWIMTAVSWLLVLVTLPFSLFFCFKVSELEGERERVVLANESPLVPHRAARAPRASDGVSALGTRIL